MLNGRIEFKANHDSKVEIVEIKQFWLAAHDHRRSIERMVQALADANGCRCRQCETKYTGDNGDQAFSDSNGLVFVVWHMD